MRNTELVVYKVKNNEIPRVFRSLIAKKNRLYNGQMEMGKITNDCQNNMQKTHTSGHTVHIHDVL